MKLEKFKDILIINTENYMACILLGTKMVKLKNQVILRMVLKMVFGTTGVRTGKSSI